MILFWIFHDFLFWSIKYEYTAAVCVMALFLLFDDLVLNDVTSVMCESFSVFRTFHVPRNRIKTTDVCSFQFIFVCACFSSLFLRKMCVALCFWFVVTAPLDACVYLSIIRYRSISFALQSPLVYRSDGQNANRKNRTTTTHRTKQSHSTENVIFLCSLEHTLTHTRVNTLTRQAKRIVNEKQIWEATVLRMCTAFSLCILNSFAAKSTNIQTQGGK